MESSARQYQDTHKAAARVAPAAAIAPVAGLFAPARGGYVVPPKKTGWLDGPSYRSAPLSHRFRKTA